jgi:ribosomal protein L9
MPSGPLRVLGEHHVDLHLHADVNVPVTVIVESVDQTE